MTRIDIPYGKAERLRPSWWGGESPGNKRTALMRCPNGHIASLLDHVIDKDGFVNPSVNCPEGSCSFHNHVRLIGWDPEGGS